MATTRDKYILEIETEQATRNVNKTSGLVGGLAGKLKGLGPLAAGAAAAFGGFAAISGIQSSIDSMDALAKQARNLKVEGDAAQAVFQTFGTVLADAGISQEQYVEASRRSIDRLSKGGKQAESVLSKIGPALKTAEGELKSGPELLQALNIAFNEGKISAEEFQAIVGVRLGPIVNRALGDVGASAENMASAMDKAAESTDFVGQDTLNNAEAFNDNMAAMQRQISSVGTEIVSALLPHLTELSEKVLANMPAIIEGVQNAFSNLQPVFSLIGTVLTDLVFPIMQKVFEVLGLIANAIAPLVDAALPALQAGFDLIATAIGFVVEKIAGFIETLTKVKDSVTATVSGIKEGFGNMTDGITSKAKSAYDGVTGWFGQMYDEVVGNSIIPDMARGVLGSFDEMSGGMISSITDAVQKVLPAFKNIAQTVSDKFEEITGISLSNVRDQVASMSSTIFNSVSNLASEVRGRMSRLFDSVSSTFSNIKSTVGGAFSGFNFTNPFAGFFANGGFIPKGQFGVVGERGPELVSGPAQVTPMAGTTQAVTYNINAVDAASFRSLLARDPGFVHAVVQRGQSIGGRR